MKKGDGAAGLGEVASARAKKAPIVNSKNTKLMFGLGVEKPDVNRCRKGPKKAIDNESPTSLDEASL